MVEFDTIVDPAAADLEVLARGIEAYNEAHLGAGAVTRDAKFAVFARDGMGQIVGGAYGDLRWDWLMVKMLWVAEAHRGQGIGSQLLARAEAQARARGVGHSHLETTDFQALGFYRKHGYQVFAQLEGKPAGHTWYYLKKDLAEPLAGLRQTLVGLFDEQGAAWLENLPGLISACERRWSITVLAPLSELSFNYVAPALRADGSEAMLKLGVPNPELATEIEALRLYDGRGCVRLLAADAEWGALLLERLRPGTMLSAVADDERTTAIAAGVMRQLWRPAPPGHAFPTVARWAAGLERLRTRFEGGTGPLPRHLVERAEALFAELLPSMAEPVLLHGDLHHFNILAAGRQPWLAIDPKGVVGEPAYEVGALLRNPFPQLLQMARPGQILARRVDQLAAELGFDRERLLGWGLAQAVLSAWWSIEDGDANWEYAIRVAELLAAL